MEGSTFRIDVGPPPKEEDTGALPSSLQREGLEQLRGYESESERRYMVEYEYAMYAPYHPDLTDVASF